MHDNGSLGYWCDKDLKLNIGSAVGRLNPWDLQRVNNSVFVLQSMAHQAHSTYLLLNSQRRLTITVQVGTLYLSLYLAGELSPQFPQGMESINHKTLLYYVR